MDVVDNDHDRCVLCKAILPVEELQLIGSFGMEFQCNYCLIGMRQVKEVPQYNIKKAKQAILHPRVR